MPSLAGAAVSRQPLEQKPAVVLSSRSQRRETQASGPSAIIGTKRDYLAACKPLGIGKNRLSVVSTLNACKTHGAKRRKKTQESAHTQC